MAQCKQCKKVNQIFQIEYPEDLTKVMHVISDNLADSSIIADTEKPMGDSTTVPFSDLASGKLWDDIIEYYFMCQKCRQMYCLNVETYHGRGGQWSPCAQ